MDKQLLVVDFVVLCFVAWQKMALKSKLTLRKYHKIFLYSVVLDPIFYSIRIH